MLQNLRQLSIYVVETIVVWREQMRYLAILNEARRSRKQRVPDMIIPFFDNRTGQNYLLKMKHDTSHFA